MNTPHPRGAQCPGAGPWALAPPLARDPPVVRSFRIYRWSCSTCTSGSRWALPERVIWSTRYFDPGWQTCIDSFNALPLIGLGAFIAWRARASAWLAFFASMAVHCVTDLLVHREDAHAHFFPLSSWRFVSPVSYWDPETLRCGGGTCRAGAGSWRRGGADDVLYAPIVARHRGARAPALARSRDLLPCPCGLGDTASVRSFLTRTIVDMKRSPGLTM